jgi:predicted dehydrogenase
MIGRKDNRHTTEITMTTNRRTFLQQAGAAGAVALSAATYARAANANERFTVALVGCGGMGNNHLRTLAKQKDVTIAYLCDADTQRMAASAKIVEDANKQRPMHIADMRKVNADKKVDAIFIATPDHWHAPATILALAAGKHVYVEKPCSHNIREGRLMIDAARRARKICQVGTQTRSSEHALAAMELLHKGAIGEILAVRVWNSQLRRNIGHQKPSKPPANLDFDLWLGPAPVVQYQSNMLHGIWRWWYDFGTGDMGNDGVHDLDIGCWGLGVTGQHPVKVAALGGKYFFDDDQQFPDTQTVVFEYEPATKNGKKKQLIFEQRIWTPYKMEGYENGDAFYGTQGMMIFGKEAGWRLYGPKNKEIKTMEGRPNLLAHHRNFFDCIQKDARPNGDIEINHYSTSLCHLGNIATRVGRVLRFDPKTEEIVNDKEAGPMVRRQYREHWARPQGA